MFEFDDTTLAEAEYQADLELRDQVYAAELTTDAADDLGFERLRERELEARIREVLGY